MILFESVYRNVILNVMGTIYSAISKWQGFVSEAIIAALLFKLHTKALVTEKACGSKRQLDWRYGCAVLRTYPQTVMKQTKFIVIEHQTKICVANCQKRFWRQFTVDTQSPVSEHNVMHGTHTHKSRATPERNSVSWPICVSPSCAATVRCICLFSD